VPFAAVGVPATTFETGAALVVLFVLLLALLAVELGGLGELGGTPKPPLPVGCLSFAPHLAQKLLVSLFSAPHFEQYIATPSVLAPANILQTGQSQEPPLKAKPDKPAPVSCRNA